MACLSAKHSVFGIGGVDVDAWGGDIWREDVGVGQVRTAGGKCPCDIAKTRISGGLCGFNGRLMTLATRQLLSEKLTVIGIQVDGR